MTIRFLPLPIAASLFLAAGAAGAADDAAILKCRALSDQSQRLACYDAVPLGLGATTSAPAPSHAAQAPAPIAAAAPTAAALAAPTAPTPEQRFGLRPEVKKEKPVEADSVRSKVVGRFDGWTPGAMIALANGQVWKVTDDSDAVLSVMQDPPVTITRGLLGAYFLQVDGIKNTARVARVK